MIVVIADDLTGAAELAGIGLRYNLNVEINTKINLDSKAELLVIDGDTRSKTKEDAVKEMFAITTKVAQLKPKLIFKKVDSVLRGHVISELETQMEALHLNRALLVSANPSFGRTVTNNTYLINGEPIHTTSFFNDPEFPITTSNVLEMLRADGVEVHVRNISSGTSKTGITVGEAVNTDDLKAWAAQLNENILAAGSAGFFTAILDRIISKTSQKIEVENITLTHPALYVCGTTFDKSRRSIAEIKNKGGPVSYMPLSVIESSDLINETYKEWATEVASLLSLHKKAIIAIDPTRVSIEETALSLRSKTALAVKEICKQINIKELLIEGGSTAAAIINELNLSKFIPAQEVLPGVVRMSVADKEDMFLTLKPGSYEWSPQLWDF